MYTNKKSITNTFCRRRYVVLYRIAMLLMVAAWSIAVSAPITPETKGTGIALSLRVLSQRLTTMHSDDPEFASVKTLGGMTDILGYTVDKINKDVILIGKKSDNGKPLDIENFIVALRNASLRYAKKKGSTTYYSAPLCSIDPDPTVMQKLQGIGAGLTGQRDAEKRHEFLETWNTTCASPQVVSVYGVPGNTQFARTMVEADYAMKKLVDGTEVIAVPGFRSHTELVLDQCRADYMLGKPISVKPSTLNRFWFSFGNTTVVEKNGTLLMPLLRIKILTESEFVEKSGKRSQAGTRDPLADEFSDQFSAFYDDILAKQPLYRDLESLFKFQFIAKAMVLKDAFEQAGCDAAELLDTYVIADAEPITTVAGRPFYTEVEVRKPVEGGSRIAYFRLPSCGGVSMDITLNDSIIVKDTRNLTPKISAQVLKERPLPDTLHWTVDLSDFK
jgi:hypothetical protein